MNTLLTFWHLLGWTMLYFLAAGTLVLLISAVLRISLKRANPRIRYTTSLAVFAVLALLPIAIATQLLTQANPTKNKNSRPEFTTNLTNSTNQLLNAEVAKDAKKNLLATEGTEITESKKSAVVVREETASISFESVLNVAVSYLPWVWLVGTPLTFLLLTSGLVGAERLRRSCQFLTDGPIHESCEKLRIALGIGRLVGIAICERVATPVLVGVVKPLILLPPAALNGWTTEELEMVLLHELSHVRRWDNAVNLAQRIVESLLFFHPAVWIMSTWVRRDREDCCDAVVVGHTAKPQAYAELLVALAANQPLAGLAASALARHPLASRIRRILKLEDEPMRVSRNTLTIVTSTALALALGMAFLGSTDAKETVSREAERVGDERSGEKLTTNPTNRTNKKLTTEDTESTEQEDTNLSEYTVVYDVKGSGAKFAELIDHLRGMSEFRVTSGNDDQIVVMARRSVHKRVAEYIDFLTSMHERPKKTPDKALRPIIYAEQTEKLSEGLYKYSFLVPWVRAVDDPVRRATTEALIKSDLILLRAIKEMNLSDGAQASVMEHLRKELIIHYSPDGHMFVALVGAKDFEAVVAAYAAPIINEYLKEHLTHLAKNQHDLATKDVELDLAATDVGPTAEESVSREAERVADERSGEELTTNPTNRTNKKLTTEDTEGTEGTEEDKDSVDILRVYTVGDRKIVDLTALLKAIHGFGQLEITSINDQQMVVRAKRKMHDKLQAYLEGLKGHENSPNTTRLGDNYTLELQELVAMIKQLREELTRKETRRDSVTGTDRERLVAEIAQMREVEQQLQKRLVTRVEATNDRKVSETTPLYDGKTFEEWRELWTTELKTENRIECINAFAAFGRAGKGQEAAEAILEVAAQYDFSMNPDYIEDDTVIKLKESILEVLTRYGNHLPEGDWLPVLKDRLDKEPTKYRELAAQVLPRLMTSDPHVKPIFSKLQKSSDQAVRQAALSAIFISQEVYTDEEKHQLIQATLAEEPVTALNVLDQRLLNFISIEQAVGFLLSEEADVQLAARKALHLFFDREKGQLLTQQLLNVLSNQDREKDQLATVRALAALGYQANAAQLPLTKLIESTDEEELMLAAAFAREMVTLERGHARMTVSPETMTAIKVSNRWKKFVSDELTLRTALAAEAARVKGEQGMGFGGGGMGGGGGMF